MLACKKINKTRSYINRSSVHWRIEGRKSCEITFFVKGCKGRECYWSENIVIHGSVSGSTLIHKGTCNGRSTTKSDGNQEAWLGSYSEEKTCNLGQIHPFFCFPIELHFWKKVLKF